MRISVCEYLRLVTNCNWFYSDPGHWVSDEGTEAIRTGPDYFELRRGSKTVKRLQYFEGLPSNVVRRLVKKGKRNNG